MHADYLDARRRRSRTRCPAVEHFVALEGARAGLARLRNDSSPARRPTSRGPTIDEDDLLSINYTSGTTARPKGVMITHRNAYMNCVGTLIHHPDGELRRAIPVDAADVSRERLDVRVDRHGRRAARTSACARSIPPASSTWRVAKRITMLCAAPTVLIGIANAPGRVAQGAPRGVRVLTAGAPPAAATIERVEQELGWTVTQRLRTHRDVAVHHRLRAAPGARARSTRPSARRSRRARAWS